MKSRWSERDAQASVERLSIDGVSEDLALRTYSARLIGSDPELVLHGGGGNGEQAARSTGFAEVADREGFIVAFPDGTGLLRHRLLGNRSGPIRKAGVSVHPLVLPSKTSFRWST